VQNNVEQFVILIIIRVLSLITKSDILNSRFFKDISMYQFKTKDKE
jgi:hypothetical protein